jgi:hypothetical protein
MKKSNFFCKANNHAIKSFILLIVLLLFSTLMNAQITVTSNGFSKLAADLNIIPYYATCQIYPDETNSAYMGIANNRFLYVYSQNVDATNYYANGVRFQSDKRIKENFRTIDNPLIKLLQLKGMKYDYILESSDSVGTEKEKQKNSKLKKNRLGFLAQDVEGILPEAVFYDQDADKYYIEYNAIIPVIVEAMKEQQTTIEGLKSRIDVLENSSAKQKSATIDGMIQASLNQNIPNPFNTKTNIEMYLPNTVSLATLYIYNMQGVQIKQIVVNARGNTSVTIEGNSLKAGMYLYTLIADGKEVDTKKMILTN